MKTLLTNCAVLAFIWLAPLSQAQVIFSENFDGQTTGNTVSGFTLVRPTAATASLGSVIIDEGPPNKALRMYDYDTASNARVEQDFTPRSDVHLSLNFRRNADIAVDPTVATTTAFYVTIGAFGLSQGTQANRDLEFRLFSNGQYRLNRGVQDASGNWVSSGITSPQNFEPSGTTFNGHTLDIFMYDGVPGGPTLAYTGPDAVGRVLDPNSFAVFIDNAMISPSSSPTANGNFGIYQSSIYATDNNLGRLGLVTGGSSALSGFDYVVDNLALSSVVVPEPSTWALFGLGGLLLSLLRRR